MVNKSVSNNNVLLTGIPRSGTTLTCNLLNKLPDVVALHEPMDVTEFPMFKRNNVLLDKVSGFFHETRQLILKDKKAPSKQENNKVPSNPFGSAKNAEGTRKTLVSRGYIDITKPLSDVFTLVIKHPAAFTAELKALKQVFPCFAVVRNPLSALASWNSVDAPVRSGHVPAAENLDPQLSAALSRIDNRADRQIYILSWFFETYEKLLPRQNVIRYEDMVSSGGKALSVITPEAEALHEELQSKNKNPLYDAVLFRELGKKLLGSEGAYWSFYSKDDVRAVMEEGKQ